MANPTFRNIENANQMPYAGPAATMQGTFTKSILLTLLTIVSAVAAGYFIGPSSAGMILFTVGAIVALLIALGICFKPNWAPALAPGYAIFEGAVLGIISVQYEMMYAGISIMAVGVTMATLFLMLFLWKTQIIKVTDKVRSMIFSMTLGVFFFYLVGMIASFFGYQLIPHSGIFGLIIAVIVAGVAAFNLLLDFDMIQQSVEAGAPDYMEYYCAFSLLVTLVWLYLEILRILQIIMSIMGNDD